jgi:hypothetical protein
MRTDIPGCDVEKTQAPPTVFGLEQEIRDKQAAYQNACERAPMGEREVLAELFSYHPPTRETLPKFQAINQAAKNFAEIVLQNCPPGSDRSGALQCIRTARMVANAAIALNGLSL